MLCTTVLHGGVCHRTSTPHKSGNKIIEEEEEAVQNINVLDMADCRK